MADATWYLLCENSTIDASSNLAPTTNINLTIKAMAIEVKVNEAQKVKRDYPYLGRYEDGTTVLFSGKNTGVCVMSGETDDAGDYRDCWCESSFTPLSPSESITLSNKA